MSAAASGTNSGASLPRLGARVEVAAADARRRAGERPDRLDDQLLAPVPGGQQGEDAEQRKLQIGDADLAIDAAQRFRLVEADQDARIGAGKPREAENAPDAVEVRRRHAAVRAPEDLAKQRMIGEILSALALLGEFRQHGPVAVEQQRGRAAARLDQGRKPPDPLQVDRRHDDRIDVVVCSERRVGRHDGRLIGGALDQVIAEHETPAAARLLDIGTVRDVDADRARAGRADEAVVRSGHRQRADPRHVERETGQEGGAVLPAAGERRIAARHHRQHGARRVDHLDLGVGAALGEIEHLFGRHLDPLGPARLELADAVERERHHGEQREQHEARADAQARHRGFAHGAAGVFFALHCCSTPRRSVPGRG